MVCVLPHVIALLTGAVPLRSGFPNGNDSTKIWLGQLWCRGIENRLIDCPSSDLGSNNCGHGSDAGVRCLSATTCTSGDVRLQGGTANEGILEICYYNVWGRVCRDLWGTDDAQVVCRQLGFSAAGK